MNFTFDRDMTGWTGWTIHSLHEDDDDDISYRQAQTKVTMCMNRKKIIE